jgi:serine/threonine-protein kinase HipA
MTSEPSQAYVWVWLPGATEPVVAGRLDRSDNHLISFTYGRSYRSRDDSISLYTPELPLDRVGPIWPLVDEIAGCIRDAGPDAWGQRVILNRRVGTAATDTTEMGILSYLLEAGPDRIGALDFQARADRYEPSPTHPATIEELATSAERVENGVPLTPELDEALLHGSSGVGGARPKALLRDHDRHLIAKFSSSSDRTPVVKGEFISMELARRSGLDVARVELTNALDHDVLLVERFDRTGDGGRRALVSVLTILEHPEFTSVPASYADLSDVIESRFTECDGTLRELFSRITFNILTGNTDDHPRNHAAFWDGQGLTLTPAYDIEPQTRSGGETVQKMAIGRDGWRMSQVAGCVARSSIYHLDEREAREIVDHQIDVISSDWDDVCDLAQLSQVPRQSYWGRQYLNPYALEGY